MIENVGFLEIFLLVAIVLMLYNAITVSYDPFTMGVALGEALVLAPILYAFIWILRKLSSPTPTPPHSLPSPPKENTEKIKEFKAKLEEWEREGYNVSKLRERWFK